jgi:glycogen(starch) synthase
MKVLMFGWELPPFNSGGLGVASLGLSKALVGQGVEVTFVLPKKIDVASNFMKIIFADEHPQEHVAQLLNGYITSKKYSQMAKIYGWGGSLMDEVLFYGELARRIAKEQTFDVIHAHDWLCFPAGIEAKKVSGKPLVVHVHATEFDRSGEKINQAIFEIEKMGMEAADKIIAVSQFTKNIIISRYGINPDKVVVVWNGIETGNFRETAHPDIVQMVRQMNCKMVLFVGRVTMQKGPDYFVDAAWRVLQFNPNVVFVMAGSGDMENQIIRHAVDLGISDRVLFTGFLRGPELDAVYKGADLFVMPSVSEPFGITALESVTHGTPVLLSKQSGVSEALHNALTVDFWDTEEMANKMLSVLGYDSLHECLSCEAMREIPKINWDAAASKCFELYKSLYHLHEGQIQHDENGRVISPMV